MNFYNQIYGSEEVLAALVKQPLMDHFVIVLCWKPGIFDSANNTYRYNTEIFSQKFYYATLARSVWTVHA